VRGAGEVTGVKRKRVRYNGRGPKAWHCNRCSQRRTQNLWLQRGWDVTRLAARCQVRRHRRSRSRPRPPRTAPCRAGLSKDRRACATRHLAVERRVGRARARPADAKLRARRRSPPWAQCRAATSFQDTSSRSSRSSSFSKRTVKVYALQRHISIGCRAPVRPPLAVSN